MSSHQRGCSRQSRLQTSLPPGLLLIRGDYVRLFKRVLASCQLAYVYDLKGDCLAMRKRAATDKPSRLNPFKKTFPYLVLIILLFLSVLVWQYYKNTTLVREERRFNEYVDNTVTRVFEQIHENEMVLMGVAGVFAATAVVDQEEWSAYFEYQQIVTEYPGIRDAAFAKVIQPSELEQHLETLRTEGYLEYTVWPEGEREVYTPVVFVAPFTESYRAGLGFDMYSDPLRRATMEKARDTGAAAISGKMTIVTETGPAPPMGFIMIVPVFEKGAQLNTPEERRAAIMGYITCFFRIEELMAGIFTDPVHKIDFELYDGTEISAETLLYDSHVTPEEGDERRPLFTSTKTIDLYGHQWTMKSESMPAFEAVADRNSHWAILGAGLSISILLFLYLKSLTTTGDRAHTLALKMTNELRESEQRTIRQRAAITGLILDDIVIAGETIPALRKITEALSGALSVERTSIWFLDESGEELQCLAMYEIKTGVHSSGTILQAKTFPRYFAAILEESRINAENAQQDPRTSELTEGYLKPLGITSMLDASITIDGKLKGVISLEHVGDPRKWHTDEEVFISTVATMTVQTFIIAERKQLEEKIIASRQMYKSVVDTQQEMIGRCLPDTTITFVNDALCRALGKSRDELLGQKFLMFLPPEEHEKRIALLSSLSPVKPSISYEERLLLPDGSTVWQEWTDQAVFDENGKVIEIQGVGHDITSRKLAEEESQRQARRTEALLKVSSRLNSELELEKVREAICEEACSALHVNLSAYLSYDENNRRFHLTASTGLPGELARAFTDLSREDYDNLIQKFGKIGVTHDLAAMPELPYAQPLLNYNIRSFTYAVVERDGFLLGIIFAGDVGEEVDLFEDPVALLGGLADQAASAVIGARMLQETKDRLRQMQALRNIDMAITGSLDLRVTFQVVLDEVTRMLNIETAAILLLDPHTGTLKYEQWRGFHSKDLNSVVLPLGKGYAGRAASERQTIHIADLREAEQDSVQGPLLAKEGFAAYFAVPLIAKGTVRGVLEVCHRQPMKTNSDWLAFLETLAGQAAIAVDNAELFFNLERSRLDLLQAYDATIEGWARALDLKDEETEAHSQRVTEMTLAMARKMNIKDEELAHVRRGALLHDIGKMGIPDSILLKPGKLTDEEWEVIRQHPVHAFNMLSGIDYLRQALDTPYCHHEKWDGSGYPRGLKGTAIPLSARIFAVVDFYDALTNDRPYRKAWSREETLALIKKESGKHFDPEVADVFLKEYGNDA